MHQSKPFNRRAILLSMKICIRAIRSIYGALCFKQQFSTASSNSPNRRRRRKREAGWSRSRLLPDRGYHLRRAGLVLWGNGEIWAKEFMQRSENIAVGSLSTPQAPTMMIVGRIQVADEEYGGCDVYRKRKRGGRSGRIKKGEGRSEHKHTSMVVVLQLLHHQ